MKVTRRSFIKTLGIATVLVMSPLGVVKGVWTPKPKKGSVLDVLEREFRSQPIGSVAHSIFGLEQEAIGTNSVLVLGWSISRDAKSLKYWIRPIYDVDWFTKTDFSAETSTVTTEILRKLKNQWGNDDHRWGKVPTRLTKKPLLGVKTRGGQLQGVF